MLQARAAQERLQGPQVACRVTGRVIGRGSGRPLQATGIAMETEIEAGIGMIAAMTAALTAATTADTIGEMTGETMAGGSDGTSAPAVTATTGTTAPIGMIGTTAAKIGTRTGGMTVTAETVAMTGETAAVIAMSMSIGIGMALVARLAHLQARAAAVAEPVLLPHRHHLQKHLLASKSCRSAMVTAMQPQQLQARLVARHDLEFRIAMARMWSGIAVGGIQRSTSEAAPRLG